MVTVSNYQKMKFSHQNYGELRLWPIAAWAVCAREVGALCPNSSREQLPQLPIMKWPVGRHGCVVKEGGCQGSGKGCGDAALQLG